MPPAEKVARMNGELTAAVDKEHAARRLVSADERLKKLESDPRVKALTKMTDVQTRR